MMGVTVHGVRKWRQQRLISYIKIGRTVRFEQAEVEAFIERHKKNVSCVCAKSA